MAHYTPHSQESLPLPLALTAPGMHLHCSHLTAPATGHLAALHSRPGLHVFWFGCLRVLGGILGYTS